MAAVTLDFLRLSVKKCCHVAAQVVLTPLTGLEGGTGPVLGAAGPRDGAGLHQVRQ